jgi:RNA polymerase sigma-70 factor (ECF subfamily)
MRFFMGGLLRVTTALNILVGTPEDFYDADFDGPHFCIYNHVIVNVRDEFWSPFRYYKRGSMPGTAVPCPLPETDWLKVGAEKSLASAEWRRIVNEFGSNIERHRRELLVHCYRMLGSMQDAEDAVQETSLRAWRYRDSLKPDAPLRPWLYRVATNACLDAIARDGRRAVVAERAAADDGRAGEPEEVVWLGPIPDSALEPPAPPEKAPEALTLKRETIEIAFLTVIQLLTPQQRAALILCDVLDWSAKDAAELLEINVAAVNSALQRARARLRERLPSKKPAWPANMDASAGERDLLKKYVAANEAADFGAFASIIREDAIFRMPPQPEVATGREAMFKLWIDGGFGSEKFGRLRCVVTRANLQPAVACYQWKAGDSAWRAMALDVLRIEEGLITEIVTFEPTTFPLFGLPMVLTDAERTSAGN